MVRGYLQSGRQTRRDYVREPSPSLRADDKAIRPQSTILGQTVFGMARSFPISPLHPVYPKTAFNYSDGVYPNSWTWLARAARKSSPNLRG
jgi:hypothetical protein